MSAAPTPTITRRLRITGKVQGVWYRGSTVEQATALGLKGWVRNRTDGSVEALVQGPPQAVQALITWAHRGPELARVSGVEVTEVLGSAEVLEGFVQRGTV
ncbi:acylphosphatase [Hydrogenophaga sp. 5NK40-0174]|uniref:acylphosphatase n=1 Tax=Hydrogenophaga sp. 5NK40-0174 TaxID=3127649 RepID=UPI00310AD973